MDNKEDISMLVCWENQRRSIKIKITDDLAAIEKAISISYQLQQMSHLHKYQIQYYDNDYQNFMDLYPESWNAFRALLDKLSSADAPAKSTKGWRLKVVSKTVQTQQRTVRESIIDDTYNYQQENDPTELSENEESFPTTINGQSTSLPSGSGVDHGETSTENLIPRNADEEATVDPPALITTNHPCRLDFESNLAGQQRQQYDKDMNRVTSSKSTIGGVRLRACPKENQTSDNTKYYPVIHFQIPTDKQHLKWFMAQVILTEADISGVHYLHASKGIHLRDKSREERCGAIRNSESVNPYVVQLTAEQIRDGRFEIQIKVCNMTDISTRKKEELRAFSRLEDSKTFNDLISPTKKTTSGLKLSSENYHLGCALICENIVYDWCISNVTTAVSSRKRNDRGRIRQRTDGVGRKKLKRN